MSKFYSFPKRFPQPRFLSLLAQVLAFMLLMVGLLSKTTNAHAANAYAAPAENPIVFRTLLIIKPVGDIHTHPYLKVQYRMNQADIEAITRAFSQYVPATVARLTRGRVRWSPDVVVSSTTLRSVYSSDNGNHVQVAPEDVGEDLDRYAPRGKYDSVFVYWKSWDEETGYRLPPIYGVSMGEPASAFYSGFACVQYDVPSAWKPDSDSTDCFIHEWIHQLESFYKGKPNVRLARGGLHAYAEHGYRHNENGWRDWLAVLLNGEIPEDGKEVGLGEAAWQNGLIRDEALRRPEPKPRDARVPASPERLALDAQRTKPQYLTPERKARNLLRNSDFSKGDDGSWQQGSFKNNKQAATVLPDTPEKGLLAVRLKPSRQTM